MQVAQQTPRGSKAAISNASGAKSPSKISPAPKAKIPTTPSTPLAHAKGGKGKGKIIIPNESPVKAVNSPAARIRMG